jgi:hypothetical protein
VHQLFIDFKKAYNSIKREVLYNILLEFGVPKKLARLIKVCLNETYSKVRIGKILSKFPIQNGLNLEINAEKTKYTIISRHPNSGLNQNIRIANESFENVAILKYSGTILTNQNDIHDEINSRLISGNVCHYSVQNLFSSRLIPKNLKIKIYKIVILPVVLYGCEIWSLTLREEHRLRVF